MKKTLSSVLAILLALAMIGAFAACNNKDDAPTTEPNTTVDDYNEPETDDVFGEETSLEDESSAEEPTSVDESESNAEETSTKPGDTTEATKPGDTTTKPAASTGLEPPADLASKSKADQLAYFNKVANNVRTAKPGFKRDSLLKLGTMEFTGIVKAFQGLIDSIKKDLMPGTWDYDTIKKNDGNDGKFLSENKNASDLKVSDITSISSKKSGENWVITVKVIKEINPAKNGGSANSRINCIASRDEVLRDITNLSDQITADVKNCTLTYHSGYATLTVNAKGQVIASESGFNVDAVANEVKLAGMITTNVKAPQSTIVKCHNFVW